MKHDLIKCPFHHEKTPSCVIDRERNRYQCLGCGAQGDLTSEFWTEVAIATSTEAKTLATDTDAECALLGALLIDGRKVHRACGIIDADHFTEPAHQEIFKAIWNGWYVKSIVPDLVSVYQWLQETKSDVDPAYVASLVDNVPARADVAELAQEVSRQHRLRNLIDYAEVKLMQSGEAGAQADELLKQARILLREMDSPD